MSRFSSAADAAAAGYRFEHRPTEHRFVLVHGDESATEAVVGEAHYTLFGDDIIDFDHTRVNRELRGTGLAALLAHLAVTDEVAQHRRLRASCWYMDRYLTQHPEVRQPD